MKSLLFILVLALLPALAYTQPRADAKDATNHLTQTTSKILTVPQLSIAERLAIQSCEKDKAEAQKLWQQAIEQERQIMSEFNIAHPGYHLNPQTFAVEADSPKTAQPVLPKDK